jgi:hypothetical protein
MLADSAASPRTILVGQHDRKDSRGRRGLLLPLILGVLLQLITGWRLPLSFWPLLAALGALAGGWHGFKGAALNSAPVAPDLGRARFAHDAEIDALTRRESNSLAIG